jgi:hypothetical protein
MDDLLLVLRSHFLTARDILKTGEDGKFSAEYRFVKIHGSFRIAHKVYIRITIDHFEVIVLK